MRTKKMNIMSLFWISGFFLISTNGNSRAIKLYSQMQKEERKTHIAEGFNIMEQSI